MWAVVYLAADRDDAEDVKNRLQAEGFLVMLRAVGAPQLSQQAALEIMVPESEAEEALEFLTQSRVAFRRSG